MDRVTLSQLDESPELAVKAWVRLQHSERGLRTSPISVGVSDAAQSRRLGLVAASDALMNRGEEVQTGLMPN